MLTADYVVGLVDGEGSFNVHVWTPKASSKRRALVELRFYLKLVNKDRSLLKKLHKFFKCGKIYRQNDYRPNHQHCSRFEVFNRSELEEKIVPFFMANPLQSITKKKDFGLFAKILKMVMQKKHLTETGLQRIQALKDQMH
jgi:hypothetical protein